MQVFFIYKFYNVVKEIDRTRYAKIMLNELRLAGYKPNEKIYLERIGNYNMNRWYDKNRFLFMAIEYLKDADKEIQISISNKMLKMFKEEQPM